MKRFVKGSPARPGEVQQYGDQVSVKFIGGKSPEIVFLDDDGNEETERVDLAPLSTEEIHALLAERGFTRHREL